MFPLSQDFVYILQLSSFFSICAVCFLLTSKSRLYIIPPITVYAVYSVWRIANLGTGYEGLAQIIITGLIFILLLIAALWIFVLKHIFRRIDMNTDINISKGALSFFAILPAVIITTYSFERQYVPKSTCSEDRIAITIGMNDYILRREYNSMIRMKSKTRSGNSQFDYSYERKSKNDLRGICNLSKSARKPITINQLWIHPHKIKNSLDMSCEKGSSYSKQFCSEYSKVKYENIYSIMLIKNSEFTRYLYGLTYYEVNNISKLKQEIDVTAEGDQQAGFVCRARDYSDVDSIYCTAWHQIDSETLIVGSTRDIADIKNNELLNQLNNAIDFTVSELLN